MLWIIVAILAYLILSVVFLVDKYLLVGHIPSPKVYTFYVGALQVFILLFIPFVNFLIPNPFQIFLSLASGAFFILGLFWFYKALWLFDASRVVPAVGGILPIFTFLLIFIFSNGKETLDFWGTLAFILLILGSVLITYERNKKISLKSLQISLLAAILLAFYFVLAKYVFLGQPFWSGFIWIRIGSLLMGIFFLFFFRKEIKEEILKKRSHFPPKATGIFLLNQLAGAGANILQNWAIALAPLAYVAIVNALQGTQYTFLLILTIFLSLKFPQILREEISKEIIFQKIIAILFIAGGLVILALK